MCLTKLSLDSQNIDTESLSSPRTSYLLQATLLLEFAWTHSKSNFQFSLLLIRFYIFLGCGSLAARAYRRLSLKQVQLDTLSFTLFDRISSQHPHPYGHVPEEETSVKTPLQHLQKQQKLYRGSIHQISKNVWLSYKQANYNSIFDIRTFSDTLAQTLSGAMSVVECRKIVRLTDPGELTQSGYGGYDVIRE